MVNQNSSTSASLPEVTGDKGSKPTIAAPVGNPPSTLLHINGLEFWNIS